MKCVNISLLRNALVIVVEKENPEKYLYAFQRYKKHNKRSKSAQPIPTPVIIQRQHAKSATKTRVRFVLDETETIQQSQPHTNPVCKTRPSISTSKPELYEDWLARKEEEITYEPAAQETTSVTQKLKKKIGKKVCDILLHSQHCTPTPLVKRTRTSEIKCKF